jgi:peptide chain release factor 1
MIPIDKVENIVSRFNELENILAKPDLKKDEFVSNSKEYSNLSEIINCAKDYLKVLEHLKSTKNILDDKSTDKEFYEMAEKELKDLKQQEEDCVKRLKVFLLPKDEADEKNAIIEIRAGTGGMEAALFAADLFNMYQKVAVLNGWKVEVINLSNSEGGGYKEIIASIVGRNVFSKLKFESGVHRVQRVPDTETQGRIHTSAATVAVLPEAEEVDVKINDADLRIDVFRSSGPGGQSVNTTDSAVRVTHIPSGIVVSQQDEKSQHKNKAKALKILRSKLYDLQRSQQESERAKARKSQIGTGDRSERIRTYNFPQGRVTDHRINMTLYKLTDFLAGDAFKELSDAIQIQFQEEQLENLKI